MEVKVCVGSACHLKGSHAVVQRFQALIQEHNLNEQVELKSSFCLGVCQNDVSVQINETIKNVSLETIDEVFKQDILGEFYE